MLIQPLKGFRDFLPEQARKRQYVIAVLRDVFESFGFEPLETPALEYEEILTGKYGEEGDKLMYRFEDNGGRRVALRYDQTVPLARVAAQYQNELPLPFKRYQIQPVWRAENTQRGRFREFLQCDIDTLGTKSPIADAELLATIIAAYQKLGFSNFKLLLNDRANFRDMPTQAITTIDKLKKIGEDGVRKELLEKKLSPELLDVLLQKQITPYLHEVMNRVKEFGISPNMFSFEPTLARGLDYYTGMIIEVEIEGYGVGSVGGGGRYDQLVGMFAGKDIPAVGFAFGFDRVMDAMEELDLFPISVLTPAALVLVTISSPELATKSLALLTKLQILGMKAEVYLDENASLEKQLKYADKKGIPYVITLGIEEVAKNEVKVRNMQTREEKVVAVEKINEALV